jgi:SagB-type dehydrogenase family enzyme
MDRAVTAAAAVRCVAAHGYAVRDLPTPLYLRAHAVALVPAGHGGDRLDLAAAAIPVLDLAVGTDRADALWRLAEAAATHRLRSRGVDDVSAGAANTAAAAAERAVHHERARRVTRADWARAVPLTGWRDELPVLREVDGGIDAFRLGGPAPTVGVRLRLAGEPDRHAVGCGPDPWTALRTAVAELLRVFLAVRLGAAPPAGHLAIDLDATAAALPIDAADDRTGLDDGGPRPSVRLLGADGDMAVAAGRIGILPAVDDEPWHRPDLSEAGLRAPVQSSLAYRAGDVRSGRLYHENSKMRAGFGTMPVVEARGMARPVRELLASAYRDFGHTRVRCPLPPHEPPAATLDECLRRRRSWAPMDAGAPIPFGRLAGVLRLAYGTTAVARSGDGVRTPLRATPAAGGLYSTDMFVLAARVDDVPPGLYYFHPGRDELQLVRSDRGLPDLADSTGYAPRVAQAAAVVIYVGAFRRCQWKYRERGYRAALLDCGHLAQAVGTAAGAAGLIAHPMIGFVDDRLNDLVGVDGVDDAVLHLTLLGEPEGNQRDRREQ